MSAINCDYFLILTQAEQRADMAKSNMNQLQKDIEYLESKDNIFIYKLIDISI